MGVWWLGRGGPPDGTEVSRAASLADTGEDDLVFLDDPCLVAGVRRSSRRVYLVTDAQVRRRLPRAIMGVIPRDPSVINAMAQLYREMRESFDLGDMLIQSLSEKDRVIREKRRLMAVNAKRYNAIIQNANDLIFIVGPTGRLTFCNDTFVKCLATGDASPVGKEISGFVSEEDRAQLQQALSKGFSHRIPVRTEVRMPLRSGRTGIISLLCAPLEENGHIYAMSVIGRDITELRAMQKRLTIQANDLSQMMNGLAHELRNPLTVIGAYVRRLSREQSSGSQKWEEALQGIYSSIRRIETMIERVEGYEKLVNFKPSLARIDLCAIVKRVLGEFTSPVPVNLDAPDELIALGDGEHVRVAFSRVFENALQTGTPQVGITLWKDDTYAYIAVRDWGPGVKDKVQTILAPFFSTDPMRIGLGLTEARIALIKIMGELEVVRQADPGAVFTLKFLLDRRRSDRT